MEGYHNEGGEEMGMPQYADLSNQQVMDHLQQQNPDNQMQQYQEEEQQEEEEESKILLSFTHFYNS